MTRVGREPAEGMQKRSVVCCKGAGLTLWAARMRLQHEFGYRLIEVDTVWPHGACRTAVISVSTAVGLDGSHPGTVMIAAVASTEDSGWDAAIMRGREAVPLEELVQQLKATVTRTRGDLSRPQDRQREPLRFRDDGRETAPAPVGRPQAT